MNMDRRRVMLWALLVGSTIFTTYQLLGNRTPTRPSVVAGATAGAAAPVAAAPGAPAPVDPATVQAPAAPPLSAQELTAWRATSASAPRDPFFTVAEIEAMGRPAMQAPEPVAPPPPLPTYTLKLVLMSGSDGRALIDSQVVQVGDRLGEERVAQILPDAVVLERDGGSRRLELAAARAVQLRVERTR
jgi:hypothetical protein